MSETFTFLSARAARHPQIVRRNQMSKVCFLNRATDFGRIGEGRGDGCVAASHSRPVVTEIIAS